MKDLQIIEKILVEKGLIGVEKSAKIFQYCAEIGSCTQNDSHYYLVNEVADLFYQINSNDLVTSLLESYGGSAPHPSQRTTTHREKRINKQSYLDR